MDIYLRGYDKEKPGDGGLLTSASSRMSSPSV